MAIAKRRKVAKRALPAKKRTVKKATARKRTPKKGAPTRAAQAKRPAKKARTRVKGVVLSYKGADGKNYKCQIDPTIVKAVARSYDAAAALAKANEGPEWVQLRPNGVGKPKRSRLGGGGMVKRAARADDQPECCYYINGRWICW